MTAGGSSDKIYFPTSHKCAISEYGVDPAALQWVRRTVLAGMSKLDTESMSKKVEYMYYRTREHVQSKYRTILIVHRDKRSGGQRNIVNVRDVLGLMLRMTRDACGKSRGDGQERVRINVPFGDFDD